MATVTGYFTQQRFISVEGTSRWNDTCAGHKNIYEALECSEYQAAVMDGSRPAITPVERHARKTWLGFSGTGQRVELRTVKRTMVEEVLDGVGEPIP
jgi:hypothetical protein